VHHPLSPPPPSPADPDLEEAVRELPLVRWAGAEARSAEDAVVREEPLEIRIGPVPVAVVMRTPGHDRELALGFLVTEGVVGSAAEVASIRHCSVGAGPGGADVAAGAGDREGSAGAGTGPDHGDDGDADAGDNVVRVGLAPGVEVDLEALRRNLYASSSCGICGKASVEAALATAPPLAERTRLSAEHLYALPDRLRAAQAAFQRTGGIHAAGLFAGDGRLRVLREDVGRHNAVDKAVGWAAGRGLLPLAGHVLLVSGRVSFEIVQKALAARIPAVAGISAPSSLAVDLAERAGLVVVGFLRGRGLNVYSGRERVGV